MNALKLVRGQESARRGREFERFVSETFQRNGFVLLKKNYWMKNYDVAIDSAIKREFDLVMFSTQESKPYIIECKAHLDTSTLVGIDLIKEFNFKLNSYMTFGAGSIMVTDTDFTPSVYEFASRARIHLLNGRGLDAMERSGSLKNKIESCAQREFFNGVCNFSQAILREYL